MKKNPFWLFLFAVFAALTGVVAVNGGSDSDAANRQTNVASTTSGIGKASTAMTAKLELPAKLKNVPEIILNRAGYTVSYNKATKIPNWVAWHLTAQHATGPAKRKGKAFTEDTSVPAPRADDWDYYNSGYDRGHMCPAGDNKWSQKAMNQSFLFTNICPQNPNLNRGDWNEIEQACRQWAKKYGDIYIICGPILFNRKHETIGKHKVVVPEAFFKCVLCLSGKPKAIAFICRNSAGNRKKDFYVNTVKQVERVTGMTFFNALSPKVASQVKDHADIHEW